MEECKSLSLAQSYELTVAGYDFTKTQKRLLYEIVKNVQSLYKGIDVRERQKAKDTKLDFVNLLGQWYIIPIKAIIGENNNNYKNLKESLEDMTKKLIRVQDDGKTFSIVTFFDKIEFPEKEGIIRVRMTMSFYESMANISRGLTVYDYAIARSFPSIYAMRMYEFIVRWDNKPPRNVPLEALRNILGVNITVKKDGKTEIVRKYPNVNNFEENTLKVAKKQLDDPKYGSPYRFDYARFFDRKGKMLGYTISVYKDSKLLSEREQRYEYSRNHDSLYLELARPVFDKLKYLGFEREEIYPHLPLLKASVKYLPDILATLAELGGQSRESNITNPKGWIIFQLRRLLEERGIYVQPDGSVIVKENVTGDLFNQFAEEFTTGKR